MAKRYINISLPLGIADEIDYHIAQGNLGYRNPTEFVLHATRDWLVTLRQKPNRPGARRA